MIGMLASALLAAVWHATVVNTDVQRAGGDYGCVAQMSFGGHHALNASDQVQKKLQEAMATDQELQDGLAGIDIRDDEDMDIDQQKLAKKMQDDLCSIASSANAMALEELRAENIRLKQEMYLADQMRENERKAAAAAAAAVAPKLTEKQIFHNRIIRNPVVVGAVCAMEDMDACTLW